MAALEDGLNYFKVPYGKAFVRVVKGVPVVVESDLWLPNKMMQAALKTAFSMDFTFGVTWERPRLPIQLFRRATLTIERIEAKTVQYEILQARAA
jgi:hypothetical protein